jgi:hypothetical protein
VREDGQSEACDTDGVESEADYRKIGSTLDLSPKGKRNEECDSFYTVSFLFTIELHIDAQLRCLY